MNRGHAILAAAVLAAALWAYFVAHPLGGGAPSGRSSVRVWDVPERQAASVTYRDGPVQVTLQSRWEAGADKPYVWVLSQLTKVAHPTPAKPGQKAPPAGPAEQAEVSTEAFKGNAAAEQALKGFASLTAERDLGKLASLDAKSLGFPAKDASLQLTPAGKPPLKLELGRLTFGDAGRYAHNPADDRVYLLPAQQLRRLVTARVTFVDRELLAFLPEQAERMELRAGGLQRTFHRLAKAGQWGATADAARPDPSAAVLATALPQLKVLRYRPESEPAPASPPALEVHLFRSGGGVEETWLRLYDGQGATATAVSSYTQRPVEVSGPIVKQLLEKARAALHGT
jgi:Domain of unknown function (DUF4340)